MISKPITRVLGLLRWRPAPRLKMTKAGAVRALCQLVGVEMLRIACGGFPAGYQMRHSRMGMKMAGRWFMILSLVTPSMFRPSPMIKTEPTQVISFCTAALPIRGASTPASREMEP